KMFVIDRIVQLILPLIDPVEAGLQANEILISKCLFFRVKAMIAIKTKVFQINLNDFRHKAKLYIFFSRQNYYPNIVHLPLNQSNILNMIKFQSCDYFNIDELIPEEHKLIRSSVREWVDRKLLPIIENYAQRAASPAQLLQPMADLG